MQPFLAKFVSFPAAIQLSVDGTGTTWGRLFEQAPSPPGFQLLHGTVAIEPVT